MALAEEVALLALVYREFEAGARAKGTSLLKRIATDQPDELDALIFSLMDKTEELADLMVELASFDELRYEALLHAWPAGPNNDPPPEGPSYGPDRWREVEDEMWEIYKTGITHSPAFVNVIFEEAYAVGLAQIGATDR